MQFKIFTFLALSLMWGMAQAAYTDPVISVKNLRTHVNFLSSDALEGRLTGSKGEKLATQYIATIFRQLGLEPAGDNGSFFQEFNFTAGGSLGKNNFLSIINQQGITKQLVVNKDWRPLAFSDNVTFENKALVFAGYGISAPELGKLSAYDSYQHLNVKNKWVIVFRYIPEKISDARARQLNPYASLRYKTFTAKEHGAKGIIFVSGPNSKAQQELIPLSFDTSISGSGMVALSVTDKVFNDLHTAIKIIGQTDIQKNRQHGRNVLATLKVSSDATRLIIVGAHVDHLGHGELSGSRARDDEAGKIHPGADDNASGVASVLEVAAYLSDLKAHGRLHGKNNILFAAWSGEEFGVLGSAHFVKNFIKYSINKSLRPTITAAINLDMVGHLRKNLVLQGTGSSLEWPALFKKINTHSTMALITQSDPYLPTDSTEFYLHGVPTLNFFTGAHDDYHTPRDTPATLNYEGIKSVSGFLVNLVLALEDTPKSLTYHAITKSSDKTVRTLKIYLGTIPDYASADVPGVKLSGVANNSPAQQAGLKAEDIIVELAGKSIHDIYDYTFVLNALHAGKPAKLIVQRGESKIALTIVARYRE